MQEWQHEVDPDSYASDLVPGQIYRVEVSPENRAVWISSSDFQPVVRLQSTLTDRTPSVLSAKFEEGDQYPTIRRLGRSRPVWSR